MPKLFFNVICNSLLVLGFLLLVFSAGAAEKKEAKDTIEFKNGEKVTGVVLNESFTVVTTYMAVTLEKEKISEITIGGDHDVVVLDVDASLVEGTIDEDDIFLNSHQVKRLPIKRKSVRRLYLK